MREHESRAWLAWHAGLLSHDLKTFPPLHELQGRPAPPVTPMSAEHQERALDRWGDAMDRLAERQAAEAAARPNRAVRIPTPTKSTPRRPKETG